MHTDKVLERFGRWLGSALVRLKYWFLGPPVSHEHRCVLCHQRVAGDARDLPTCGPKCPEPPYEHTVCNACMKEIQDGEPADLT